MKVKELIQELEKFDQDLEVSVQFSVGYVDIAKPYKQKLWVNRKQEERVTIIGKVPKENIYYKQNSIWKKLKDICRTSVQL